jgi:hypothetical protein
MKRRRGEPKNPTEAQALARVARGERREVEGAPRLGLGLGAAAIGKLGHRRS